MANKIQTHRIADFPMPSTAQYELQVLADIIKPGNGRAFLAHALKTISADTFVFHREAFERLKQKYDDGRELDLICARTCIQSDEVSNIAEFFQYASDNYPRFETHLQSLVDMRLRLNVYQSAVNILQTTSTDKAVSSGELLTLAKSCLDSATNGAVGGKESQTITEAVRDWRKRIAHDQAERASGKATTITTGVELIDEKLTGGLSRGQLVVLAARPSVGKTAFMLTMAKAAALAGHSAAIYSLEMTNHELITRLMYSGGEITPAHVYRDMPNELCDQESDKLAALPMVLNQEVKTLDELRVQIVADHERGKADIAFIDYLQLIQDPNNATKPKHEQVGEITRQLKALAKECQIPIVVLSQLSREADKEGGSPELHHLKDSGSIEQDADIVMLLYNPTREEDGREIPDRERLMIRLAKNRGGKREDEYCMRCNETRTRYTLETILVY